MSTAELRDAAAPRGAERRRAKRYQVDLPATVRRNGDPDAQACPVSVSDLSASGALVTVAEFDCGFQFGEPITLFLTEFGPIEAQVVHVGSQFYGLQFLTPTSTGTTSRRG